MFKFEDDIIDTHARYHVFIGVSNSIEDKEAFQVCKYSLFSLSSEPISIISIPSKDFLKIPSICSENRLRGKALYIPEQTLFKDDVVKLFASTEKSPNAMLWATKFDKARILWHTTLIFNLGSHRLHELLPIDKIDNWTYSYKVHFKWISRRDTIIDLEVNPLPLDWNNIDGVTSKDNSVRSINFDGRMPYYSGVTKHPYSKDWYKEYQLFLENEVIPKLLTITR